MFNDFDKIIAKFQKDAETLITELKETVKEKQPTEYKRWRSENDGVYYYIDDCGKCDSAYEGYGSIDDYRYNTGNYFKTEKEAEQHKAYLLALQTIKDDAEGWIPDWEDKDEEKCFTYYDHEYKVPGTDKNSLIQFPGMIYFQTEKKLRHSLITHEAEWLTVLGVEQ